MKVYGKYSVMKVNQNGMNFVLRACGYPTQEHMDKWSWKDFHAYHEGEEFVKDAEALELEFQLNRIKAKDLNPSFMYNANKDYDTCDEYYDDYLDWLATNN